MMPQIVDKHQLGLQDMITMVKLIMDLDVDSFEETLKEHQTKDYHRQNLLKWMMNLMIKFDLRITLMKNWDHVMDSWDYYHIIKQLTSSHMIINPDFVP